MGSRSTRVVVTGLGAITPLGNTTPSFWEGALAGQSSAAPITLFDASAMAVRFACEVKDFDVDLHVGKRIGRRTDRYTQFAIVTAREALQDAFGESGPANKEEVAVIWASGIGGLKKFQDGVVESMALSRDRAENATSAVELKGNGLSDFNPFFIPGLISNIAGGWISMEHGFMGPSFTPVSACASSNHALVSAALLLRQGLCKVAVVGGSEAAIVEAGVGGFSALKALSKRNDDPQTASRPYDSGRDGFVLGEGAGCLVLEELEHARERGAHIYAELTGFGASSDAYHLTAPSPDGSGAYLSMMRAFDDAGILPAEVDYVNTHATSTTLGDIAEMRAIERVFKEHVYGLNISSTKSMTGHLLGAAGAVEAIICCKAIQEGIIPPTINTQELDENFDSKINYTLGTAQRRAVRYAVSNSFGFGGQNATVIFSSYEDRA